MADCNHHIHAGESTNWNWECENCGAVVPRGITQINVAFGMYVENEALKADNAYLVEALEKITTTTGRASIYKIAENALRKSRGTE